MAFEFYLRLDFIATIYCWLRIENGRYIVVSRQEFKG